MGIDNIKEYYAKERGFESWSEFLNNIHGFQIPSHMTEIAERYAQSQTQDLQEQNAELVMTLDTIASLITSQTSMSTVKESLLQILTKYNHLNKKP